MHQLKSQFLNSDTDLRFFSIVTYAVDPIKLKKLIDENYDPYVIYIDKIQYGLVSAVTFLDTNFKFSCAPRLSGSNFWQTNYRAYVKNKFTDNNMVWFFRTTLGSNIVHFPKLLWKMPWYFGYYSTEISNNSFELNCESRGANFALNLNYSNGEHEIRGFSSREEAIKILTDPQIGRYKRTDGKIGGYEIRHEKMKIRHGVANNLYFELFDRLGLVNGDAFLSPHSILVTDSIHFEIQLPPTVISNLIR